jgi:hypothetical protein
MTPPPALRFLIEWHETRRGVYVKMTDVLRIEPMDKMGVGRSEEGGKNGSAYFEAGDITVMSLRKKRRRCFYR